MKKLLTILLSCFMVLSLVACSTPAETVTEGAVSGTFTGEAEGFQGKVVATVTIDNNAITEISFDESENKSQLLSDDARAEFASKIVNTQSLEVEAVSGATVSSSAFISAVEAALTSAGLEASDLTAVTTTVEKTEVEETVDVVVAGAGGAGTAAALTALQNGKTVIVVEKQGITGGATAMAGGGTVATGSAWALEDGYTETAEELKATMFANGHNNNYEPTLDVFVNNVGEAFNWLVAEDGANVAYVRDSSSRTYSADGRGAAVVSTLVAGIEANGGKILTGTPATELLVEDGKVVGLIAESEDTKYTIHASSVILATGGFGANDEMVPDKYKAFVYAGAAGTTGDGIKMAEAVNANLVNMEFVNVQPNSIVKPSGLGQYTNPGVNGAYNTSGAFLVSDQGVRFANEVGSSWVLLNAMAENEATYLICDQASFDAFNAGMMKSHIYSEEDLATWLENEGSSNPLFIGADTLTELASKLGLPEGTLEATAEKFNEDVKAGTDEFGRELSHELAGEGKYYAVQMWNRYYATLGGLEINENCQVLNTNGEVIEGLYAVGETAGGLEGDIYYPGSLFSWAMTSGHVAGLAASK